MTIARARGRDEGMTLVELVVASAILFFAVTAVFGLIIASTGLSVTAKQQNVAINAANSYMEYVRSLPYEAVGVPGQSVVGSLTADTVSSLGGFSVSIRPTVTWVDDPNIIGPQDYKKVVIITTVTAPNGGKVITRTFSTYVRKSTDMQTPPDWKPPTIAFNAGSPTSGSGVSGNWVHVQVTATAQMDQGTIQDVSFRCDTGLLQGWGTGAVQSAHWGNLSSKTGTFDFWWNTQYVFSDGTTLRDGPHWLVADVVDSIGQSKEVRVGIVIDNVGPTALSSPPTATVTSDVAARVDWGKAWDPFGPVDVGADCYGYNLTFRRQPTTAAATFGDWTLLDNPTVVAQVTYPAVTAGLGRYGVNVTPVSILGHTAASQYVIWVSPPLASGTYADISTKPNKWHQMKNVISLSAPTFQNSVRTYTLYRASSASGPWTVVNTNATLGATAAYSYTDTLAVDAPLSYYYRVQVLITPSGLGDLTPVTVQSNIIGPNGKSGSGNLASVGW